MPIDQELLAALDTFVTEARELVQDLEEGLLELEDNPAAGEIVNAVFRAVHTMKGSAGLFGLDPLVHFAHVVETILDSVRDGQLDVTNDLVSALLPCADHISVLVEAVASGQLESTPAIADSGAALVAGLQPYLTAEATSHEKGETQQRTPQRTRPWQLRLRFGQDSLRNGMDPVSFLRYLSTIGTVTRVVTLTDQLPHIADADPETCYLGFEVGLSTAAAKSEIEEVFDFVREDSQIQILPADDQVEAEVKQKKVVETRAADTQTIRVDAARLDKLIDLVGELVIAQASAGTRASLGQLVGVMEAQSEVMRLVEEVRHSALSLRMVPIGTTLRRFERVVRDVSVELDKDVGLVVTGGDAEMDKALVERIADPLLHLVRNALDHGIESRSQRVALGKPARGTLRLNAYHDAGCIVIEVVDDGRGLDRARILAKAVDRGLIDPAATPSDQDVYNLIFEPGFSTADAISNLSGRGVGMDVVRRNVMALRGNIEVDTELGVGTTIRLRLPLTLAIIDGFLVAVGSSSFVIPLDRVTECIEMTSDVHWRDCIDLRGEVLPLIRLRSVFDLDGQPSRRQSIVVVEEAGQRTGLVVDSLLGQFQTVIKPLGTLFTQVKCVAGATILGSGDVALILDVGPLVAAQIEREAALQAA
jgi:two-component system chemotaxis sensor kinase CheA